MELNNNINNIEDIDIVDQNGIEYINLSEIIDVFSSVQYDSLQKAASEIIDNSIDANASNIFVYIRTKFNSKKGKQTVKEIAFIDNGVGMTPGRLQRCVGFGRSYGDTSNRIGRFGVGMNQASLYASEGFKIYSWTSENEVYMLDFDPVYIRKNNIKKAMPPKKENLPNYITKDPLFERFKNHGTLLIWTDIKSKHYAKASTIASRMEKEFSVIFRNYLWDNTVSIVIQNDDYLTNIHAVDPMFLLENTDKLGDVNGTSKLCDSGEPLFEPFSNDILVNGQKTYKVPYEKKDLSIGYANVVLKASIVKEKFYYKAAYKDGFRQPGDTEIGKYVKEFQNGITVMRNGRQIDFNYFNFYDSTNQPQDRWFKIQIEFTQELDDVFDVSNNKQHVTIKKVPNNRIGEYNIDDPNYPIWLRLNEDITKILGDMRSRNKRLATNAKKNVVQKEDDLNTIEDVNDLLNDNNNDSFNDDTTEQVELFEDYIETINVDDIDITEFEDVQKTVKVESMFEKFLNKENISLFYEELDDSEIYELKYDFDLNKYIITLNSNIINSENENIIMIICLIAKKIDNLDSSSIEYLLLKNIIDQYIKYSKDL